jgi:hypothetical protein
LGRSARLKDDSEYERVSTHTLSIIGVTLASGQHSSGTLIMARFQNSTIITLKLRARQFVPVLLLVGAFGATGPALAQDSGAATATSESLPVTTAAIPAMTLDNANGHTGNEQSTPATATTATPAPRMTWDSTAPELDAFGNETVPVFTATSPTR